MCDPVTLAMGSMAIGGIQAVVGYKGAQAQYQSQMEAYRQNAENSARAAADDYSNLNIRQQQEQQANAQQMQEQEIETARAVAAAETAAGENGVSGLSVSAVLRDLYAQQGRNEATMDSNLRMNQGYLQGQLKAANRNAQNQVNSMPIPEKPSALPFLLGAVGSGLNAYTTKLQLEK